jgi:Zn-dependent M28 family amino/carboxypeptidase
VKGRLELRRDVRRAGALAALALSGAIGVGLAPPRAACAAAPPGPIERRVATTKGIRAAAPLASSDSSYEIGLVRELAGPAYEGRGIGTHGIERAAFLIAGDMRTFGLRGAGEESIGDTTLPAPFGQPFEVTTGVTVGAPCAVSVAGHTFAVGADMQPIGFSTNGTLAAPVVFAGYGITAPGFAYDDYAGLDARDKIVLVLSNEPGEMDSTSRFDGSVNTPHAELRTKAINAREHGALALLVVDGPQWHAGEPLRPPSLTGTGYMTSGLLAARVSAPIAEALLAPAGLDLKTAQRAIEAHQSPHSFALPESARVTVTLKRTRARIANVVGWIPGRDTTRTLVIGAHYDHLGYGGEGSLAPDSHLPHLGADDNASGVAALMGMARDLGRRMKSGWRPEHNLVFCAFTGEESGLLGSGHFVDDPPRPIESIEAMLNMDMVGRLRDNKLLVSGVGTADELPAVVADANRADPFDLKTSQDGYGPSDHSSFYKKQIPVLFLFTGSHADYHKPSDTWDKINERGLWRVSRFAEALVESLDARPRVHYRKAESDSSMGRIGGGGGYGAYLGTIPDYMQTEGGVLLSGVRSGGPADQAGLKGGDVIVKFDGVRIDNIYDYTYALRSRKPGQSVRITVKRGSQELDLVATLGRRP